MILGNIVDCNNLKVQLFSTPVLD